MQQPILMGFFLAVALAAMSACTTNDIGRSVASYDQVKGQVNLGDSRQQVLSLLEPTQAYLDAASRKVPDRYIDGNSTVEVYYYRSSYQADALITDDEFTPYIFRDGVLVGIGWAMLRAPLPAAETPSAAAAGKLNFNPYSNSPPDATPYSPSQSNPETFILYGYHSVSCQSWTQARAENSEQVGQLEAWVTGFLSGAGWRNAAMAQTDYAAIHYHLDDYCKRYPANDLFKATRALVSKLKTRNR